MPVNKKKSVKSVEQVEQTEQTEQAEQTEQTEQAEQTEQTEQKTTNRLVNRAGRTLLVKSVSDSSINGTIFNNLEGLVNNFETKTTNSFFLTFDNISNAVKSFHKLRNDSPYYRVKFSYYRVFFTMKGLDDSTDYNKVKKELVDYVYDKTDSSVLYCKLYRKNNKFIGCGDLTLDTLEAMNTLVSKDSANNEYTIGSLNGSFFRYNKASALIQ